MFVCLCLLFSEAHTHTHYFSYSRSKYLDFFWNITSLIFIVYSSHINTIEPIFFLLSIRDFFPVDHLLLSMSRCEQENRKTKINPCLRMYVCLIIIISVWSLANLWEMRKKKKNYTSYYIDADKKNKTLIIMFLEDCH